MPDTENLDLSHIPNKNLFLSSHIDYYAYLCYCKGVLARLGG